MATVNEKMTAIADEIRTLSGTTSAMGLDAMASNVGDANDTISDQTGLLNQVKAALEGKAGGSGVELPTLTNEAIASQLLVGEQLIGSDGKVVTGTMPYSEVSIIGDYEYHITQGYTTARLLQPPHGMLYAPTIEVSASGVITATNNIDYGLITGGDIADKSATKQLTTQGAQTITPSTSDKTIASGRYLTGTQTIKGDANLVAENIKSGVSIFGVTGTLEESSGGSGGGSVGTCTVTIISSSDELQDAGAAGYLSWTSIENGSWVANHYSWQGVHKDEIVHTLENVVCGTSIVMMDYSGVAIIQSVSSNMQTLNTNMGIWDIAVFQSPLTAGDIGTITLDG